MIDFLENMTQKDKAEFRRICSRLIGTCFVCKSDDASRKDYFFIMKYRDVFRDYLDILGLRLEVNEEYGVVQLTSPQGYNHLNLKLYESIILLILRILFDEKKREISMSDEVIISVGDIHDRYLSLNIRDKMIDKTTLRNALQLFRRFHIIELLDRDVTDEETRLLIYDSILMAVRVEDIKDAYRKLEIYRKGRGRTDEETGENQAD